MKERFLKAGKLGERADDPSALPPTLFTLHQIGDFLGVSDAVARHLCRTRKVMALKVGGRWRARPDDLMQFIKTQLQEP